ncbi:MAG TPA: hypothetical protein VN702_23440 [Acetobacteraceae bacterium]|nr:hypothetical protein [Acetobacteraceae bacterium]
MAVDLEAKSTKELETIVANCERLKRTSDPIYIATKGVLENRLTGDFDMEKTIKTILEYGRRGQFLCYKDVADASGLEWSKSRRRVGRHLDSVCIFTESKTWPLITAIVVYKDRIDTGEMGAENLKGFLDAARAAGRNIDIEENAFVRREQRRVFDWCQREH